MADKKQRVAVVNDPLRRPHHMAYPLNPPCICGSVWQRPGLDLSDEDAEELDIIELCAGCKRRVAVPSRVGDTT